jgi:hypothetical protein
VIPLADWQTSAAGGQGVLREVAREILRAKDGSPDSLDD